MAIFRSAFPENGVCMPYGAFSTSVAVEFPQEPLTVAPQFDLVNDAGPHAHHYLARQLSLARMLVSAFPAPCFCRLEFIMPGLCTSSRCRYDGSLLWAGERADTAHGGGVVVDGSLAIVADFYSRSSIFVIVEDEYDRLIRQF